MLCGMLMPVDFLNYTMNSQVLAGAFIYLYSKENGAFLFRDLYLRQAFIIYFSVLQVYFMRFPVCSCFNILLMAFALMLTQHLLCVYLLLE